MLISLKKLSLILLISTLVACGGGGGGNTFNEDPGTGDPGDPDDPADPDDPIVNMGNCTGPFDEGVLAIGLTPISAGGTTSVQANLVLDGDCGTPYTTPTDIAFSSPCLAAGLASLDELVTTINGLAFSTYTALGCSDDDLITATASVNGEFLTATTTVNVLPAEIGSIQFISATPRTIAIKGTGGLGLQETSTVIFKVLDDTGGLVTNQEVDFTLNIPVSNSGVTFSGGVTDTSGFTNSNGEVQVIVNSGVIHTTVRVTATVVGTTISTQSVALTVTTGVPDQDSFAVVLETLNPESFNTFGVDIEVTAFVADHFNNPAPNGTSVAFTTEGGFIGGNCETTDGTCSVTWTSTLPRPHDGRVTILGTATGDESFTDVNANGFFDDADIDNTMAPNFGDLPEAYRDDNENGMRDDETSITGADEFLDFNASFTYDSPNTMYNGVLCAHSNIAICDPLNPVHIHVRDQAVLVMADGNQIINVTGPDPAFDGSDPTCHDPVAFTLDPAADFDPTHTDCFGNGGIDISGGLTGVEIRLWDVRGQVPPIGTTINIEATNGSIEGSDSFVMPNTSGYGPYTVNIFLTPDEEPDQGILTITSTSPGGLEVVRVLTISDIPPP